MRIFRIDKGELESDPYLMTLHINLDQIAMVLQSDTGGAIALSSGENLALKKVAFDRLMQALNSK